MKKTSALLLMAVLCAFLCFPAGAAKSVVSRDDGVWLFPAESRFYNSFTDYAGCRCTVAHSGNPGGHNGIDVGAHEGSNVYAAADGVYYKHEEVDINRGKYVVVEHAIGNGSSYYTCYQHLQSCGSQANGSSVKAGDIIGKVGNTGKNFGIHLHFAIYLGASGYGLGGVDKYEYWDEKLSDSVIWVTRPEQTDGRINNNPSLRNFNGEYAGKPGGTDYAKSELESHCGSVTYTFNKNEVSLHSQGGELTAKVNANGSITLSWGDAGWAGWWVRRSTNPDGPWDNTVAEVPAGTTSWTDPYVNPNTRYYYHLQPFNANRQGQDYSNRADALTPASTPMVTNLKASVNNNSKSVTLTWNTDGAGTAIGSTVPRHRTKTGEKP